MPFKRVTYIDIGLNTVDAYWNRILVPNVKAFRKTPSQRSLFSAAVSVWHLHDWVWHERYRGQNSRGTTFDSYRDKLLAGCPELEVLRDIADASKHGGLGRKTTVKGAKRQRVGGFLFYGIPSSVPTFRFVLIDGSKVGAKKVLRAACDFWRTKELNGMNLPSPCA